MKFHRALLTTLLVCLGAAGTSDAQPPQPAYTGPAPTGADVSLSGVKPTPEMWLYVQERQRYDDPQAAVRRKAEFRARQRQQRIAAMKAYGYSKQRPLVYHTPFYSMFTVRNDAGWPVIWPSYTVHLPVTSDPSR